MIIFKSMNIKLLEITAVLEKKNTVEKKSSKQYLSQSKIGKPIFVRF